MTGLRSKALPTSAHGLNQRHRRRLAVGLQLHQRAARALGGGLGADHFGKAHLPCPVTVQLLLFGQVGGAGGLFAQGLLLLQHAGGHQLVLHVLEG